MKTMTSLLLVGALAGASFAIWPEDRVSEAGKAVAEKGRLSRYRLIVSGRDESCLVEKGVETGLNAAELKAEEGCYRLLPRLADARIWKRDDEGDVVFAAADGREIARFFAADGVAFESVKPASPLMLLTAE
ncbi:hypothetical protein [Nitratireductor thuwali]|uniref:Alkaline proteinase inhibitor/ Outer membrane lipoprotein Omp19 domain-containing protein n=1 Tax=Nitratireductor thuwali TaxID=2267699 RepID=A0ABY5MIA0_9HYPH|nr:hypothetical protein NTH_01386 [Nitratireductor thuwali]